jgi:NADH:ubiquinone oxidoreductase subunit 2 (subunit N)
VTNETVYLLLPEIILVLAGTFIYLGGAFLPARPVWSWLATIAIVAAAAALFQQGTTESVQQALAKGSVSGPITIDWFSHVFRYGVLGVGLIFVLTGSHWLPSGQGDSSEFQGSLVMMLAGWS